MGLPICCPPLPFPLQLVTMPPTLNRSNTVGSLQANLNAPKETPAAQPPPSVSTSTSSAALPPPRRALSRSNTWGSISERSHGDKQHSSPARAPLSRGSSGGSLKKLRTALSRTAKQPTADVISGLAAIKKACAAQSEASSSSAGFVGAEQLFRKDGLHPALWGVSKSQLQEFGEMAKEALRRGEIRNDEVPGVEPYPHELFEDPSIGPTMHQVCAGLIKPWTERAHDFLPGASWALHKNHRRPLRCALYVSHAWHEGVFEFVDHVLRKWPDECEGAYICCLSNPQNLDISRLLGDRLEDSPFYRVLHAGTAIAKPDRMLLVANSAVAIHTRAWCCLEALYAHEARIDIEIAGEPLHLLMGEARESLLLKQNMVRAAQEVAERQHAQSSPTRRDAAAKRRSFALDERSERDSGGAEQVHRVETEAMLKQEAAQTLDALERDFAQVRRTDDH